MIFSEGREVTSSAGHVRWLLAAPVVSAGDNTKETRWMNPGVSFTRSGRIERVGVRRGRAGELVAALLEARSLAAQPTHVVEVLAAHLIVAHDLDLINARRVQQEAALHTDVVCDAAHGE